VGFAWVLFLGIPAGGAALVNATLRTLLADLRCFKTIAEVDMDSVPSETFKHNLRAVPTAG